MQNSTLQKALEAVEALSLDEQKILLDIIKKRLHQERRAELVRETLEVQKEYKEGKVKFGSVDDFLKELDQNENVRS